MKEVATQQGVIKAFMRSLDNTTLSGAAALDEAIRNSSGGKFSDMQDLIDSFIRDVQAHGGTYVNYDSQTEKFLKDYCGIILEIKGDDLILWNEDRYSSSKLTLKDTKASDVTILDSSGNPVTSWQQTATLSKSVVSDCVAESAGSTSLYFDDDTSYVDSDSMMLDAVTQSQESLTEQKLAQDMVALSSETNLGTDKGLLAGNAVTPTEISSLGETATVSTSTSMNDDLLKNK